MTDMGNQPPQQRRVTFDPTVNLGHVLTMLGLAITIVAGGWGVMQSINNVDMRVGVMERQLGTMGRLLESSIRMETEVEGIDRRVTVLEGKAK
ncbi:hypothetical protein ACRC7T_04020 [Segnochrobactraceae bacterium EtOH-i3]